MNKEKIILFLKSKGILGPKGKRKSCWRVYWDNECQDIFSKYSKSYRSEEEAWFCLLHNVEPPKCPICGSLCTFTGRLKGRNNGYNTVCDKCSANQIIEKRLSVSQTKKSYTESRKREILRTRKKTNLERYGEESYMCYGSNSFHNKMIERYGDPHYSNREKTRKTNLERYGVEHNFQIPGHQEKAIKTKIIRYGNASNYEKTKLTNLKRYGLEHIGQVKRFQIQATATKNSYIKSIEKEYNCTHQQKLFEKYGRGWKSLGLEKICMGGYVFIDNSYIELIKKYYEEGSHTNQYTSKKEKELFQYIKSIYEDEILENVTNIVSNGNHRYYELDVYLPKLKLAFDFDGTYWHSDKFKDKFYHQRKTLACYNQDVQLVHIYEYMWNHNQENIKSMIRSIIKDQNSGTQYNCPPINIYKNYKLSDPEKIRIECGNNEYVIYNEGKFIEKL